MATQLTQHGMHACGPHTHSLSFTHTYGHPTLPQSLSAALTACNTLFPPIYRNGLNCFDCMTLFFSSVTEPLIQFLDAYFKSSIWLGLHFPPSSEYSSTDSFITLLKGLYICCSEHAQLPRLPGAWGKHTSAGHDLFHCPTETPN